MNRMAICMSSDSIIRLQNKMNEQLEGRVIIWKGDIEENRGALKLAKEVERKQGSETLVEDNIDYEIHARVQSQQHKNRSIHWTHQFAVLDRIQDPSLDNYSSQNRVSKIQLADLLPDKNVQEILARNWAVIVSRVITKYLPPSHSFQDVVVRHIPHAYSKEVSEKSESIERARNVIWTYRDGVDEYERLEGMDTEFADWHARYTLYKTRHPNALFIDIENNKSEVAAGGMKLRHTTCHLVMDMTSEILLATTSADFDVVLYVFKTKATRNRHEEKKHGKKLADAVFPKEDSRDDLKFNYHSAKLTSGLLL
ncbi:hypothetical protein AWC38_SpisGene19734 [Stylophora pistillata]|uniref:Uncharacterized protein n=1 Tax=Stylophora pistillata TaxID=50429 RepID=A0A2B4RGR6_STYPI|nr:hypothetical protein AWC38_SpisGene19734 [Stylophora pistillata]